MRLIARDGVAALSTRTMARDAAVTRATVHALFGHKDDLLLAVLDAATSAMIAALVVDAHPGGGLRAAVADSFAALCALLDREPALPVVRCAVLLYASRRPSQAAAVLQQQRYLSGLRLHLHPISVARRPLYIPVVFYQCIEKNTRDRDG